MEMRTIGLPAVLSIFSEEALVDGNYRTLVHDYLRQFCGDTAFSAVCPRRRKG